MNSYRGTDLYVQGVSIKLKLDKEIFSKTQNLRIDMSMRYMCDSVLLMLTGSTHNLDIMLLMIRMRMLGRINLVVSHTN